MTRKLELLFEYGDDESRVVEISTDSARAVTFEHLDEQIRQHSRPLRIWLDNTIQARDQNVQDWAAINAVPIVRLRFGDRRMLDRFEWLHCKATIKRPSNPTRGA